MKNVSHHENMSGEGEGGGGTDLSRPLAHAIVPTSLLETMHSKPHDAGQQLGKRTNDYYSAVVEAVTPCVDAGKRSFAIGFALRSFAVIGFAFPTLPSSSTDMPWILMGASSWACAWAPLISSCSFQSVMEDVVE